MYECPICGRELKNARARHAHMMKDHLVDYRAHNCRVANYVSDEEKGDPIPAGFRLLNKSDVVERAAYEQGFRFIDDQEEIYNVDDVKSRGWI